MLASSAIISDATDNGAVALRQHDVGEGMSVADISGALGVSDAGTCALASAGLLGVAAMPGLFARRSIEDLAERLWHAALPTASDVSGVRLRDAVEAAGVGPDMWPKVGSLNAFRRRGAFAGPVLAALVVSSERVVAELAPTSDDASEAPFIWTPTAPDKASANFGG